MPHLNHVNGFEISISFYLLYDCISETRYFIEMHGNSKLAMTSCPPLPGMPGKLIENYAGTFTVRSCHRVGLLVEFTNKRMNLEDGSRVGLYLHFLALFDSSTCLDL